MSDEVSGLYSNDWRIETVWFKKAMKAVKKSLQCGGSILSAVTNIASYLQKVTLCFMKKRKCTLVELFRVSLQRFINVNHVK